MLATRHVHAFTIVLSVVVLGGCATLSKEECETAQWKELGYEDGLSGYPSTRISRHREACAEHGIGVAADRYWQGHEKGNGVYCTETDAYQLGLDGGHYRGVCNRKFGERYRVGKKIHDYRQEIRSLKYEINELVEKHNDSDDAGKRRRYKRKIRNREEEIDELREKIIANQLFRKDGDLIHKLLD